jgi:endonuclease-3
MLRPYPEKALFFPRNTYPLKHILFPGLAFQTIFMYQRFPHQFNPQHHFFAMPIKRMSVRKRAAVVLERLSLRYPNPETALTWSTPWELLVATMLSAQCTDERVNKVTPNVFAKWPDIPSQAEADPTEVEDVVRSTGFFRNKAKNMIGAARMCLELHDSEVPRTMAELIRLPGVARKTANIVLSNAFNIHEGIAIDTHVKRISFRLGLTKSDNPTIIERDLMPLFPRPQWGDINHCLVLFGREVCRARKPVCGECELKDICPKHGVA